MASYVKARSGRRNTGSKQQICPGKWSVVVTDGNKVDGGRRQVRRVVYGSEADADAKIEEIKKDLGIMPCINTGYTLQRYFDERFLANRADLANATIETHKNMWKHVPQSWKDDDLVERSYDEVQQWILSLAPGVAQTAMKTFRAVNNAAWYDGFFTEKPYKAPFRFPKVRGRGAKKRRVIWTARMVAQAMLALEGSDIYGLYLCAAGAGLRRGEGIALDWENIEFEPYEVDDDGNVLHWWARVTIDSAVTALDGETDTKTDESYRVCPLAPVFADRLFKISENDGPVAMSRLKRRMSLATVRRHWEGSFNEGGRLVALPKIPLGRLRHTNSTIMRQNGVADSTIADYHGHIDPTSVDQQHYLMPTDETLDAAAEIFGNAIQRELDRLEMQAKARRTQ